MPRQARSRAKQEQLLAAALALFDERGFEATTIDAIAGHAGVSVGIFYRYFRSKEQILLDLTQERLAEIRLNLGDVRSAPLSVAELEQRLSAFLVSARHFSGLRRARQELLLRRPELALIEQQQFDLLCQELAANIEQGRLSGLLRPDLDAAATAVTDPAPGHATAQSSAATHGRAVGACHSGGSTDDLSRAGAGLGGTMVALAIDQ